MLSSDAAAPVDCPSLSKDYLAGNASEDGVPLRPTSFYSESAIDLRVATEVVRLDPGSREIASSDGQSIRYDRLLLATGAEPVRHWNPRSDQAHVHSLRSLADCRAIIARAQTRAGQSFLVQILSGLRLRLLCVAAASRFMRRQ
jgi:NAD(P)H-nitrite reductase large subunit